MRFFIDENLPPAIADSLSLVFRSHTFRTFSQEGLGGSKDLALFKTLNARRFGAIVTSDRNQVVHNDPERMALYENRLHWIGVTQPSTSGLHLIACWIASLTAAFPHILDEMASSATEPTWFAVKGIPIESAQRIRSGDIWRGQWGARPPSPVRRRTGGPMRPKRRSKSDDG